MSVLVYSDKQDLALEIAGKAREFADQLQTKLEAVVIGAGVQMQADELVRVGVDRVHLADDERFKQFQIEPYVSVLMRVITELKPDVVLFGSTKNGKVAAARVATKLDVGCVPDCYRLSIDAQKRLVGERITYGGNASAKMTFKSKPEIVTVPSRAFEKPEPRAHSGEMVDVDVKDIDIAKTEIVEVKPLESSSVRIEDSSVVVSCGRGLEKKEDRVLLDDLAGVLCGQVGCSRPLAEDRKWFGDWVGLSGHKVKPKLYIACGISGVIQHVAGIRDAKVIVAINKDPEAPIFEVADYGVVGNLYEVLPALKEAIKKQLG